MAADPGGSPLLHGDPGCSRVSRFGSRVSPVQRLSCSSSGCSFPWWAPLPRPIGSTTTTMTSPAKRRLGSSSGRFCLQSGSGSTSSSSTASRRQRTCSPVAILPIRRYPSIAPFSLPSSSFRWRSSLEFCDTACGTSNGLVTRTTVYAVATGLLTGAYALFVVVAQLVLGNVAASPLIDSKPAVAVTSFLFLSAFRPVRDRVQIFIDKRFNRSRYDAQVTVERFADDLQHEVDLAGIVGRLDRVLYEVIQPRHISVWVGEQKEREKVDR